MGLLVRGQVGVRAGCLQKGGSGRGIERGCGRGRSGMPQVAVTGCL